MVLPHLEFRTEERAPISILHPLDVVKCILRRQLTKTTLKTLRVIWTGNVDVHFKRFARTPRTRITAGWSEPVSGRELHPLKTSALSRRTIALGYNALREAP
jgi:hypothetical protein